jgi:hypothetical protein
VLPGVPLLSALRVNLNVDGCKLASRHVVMFDFSPPLMTPSSVPTSSLTIFPSPLVRAWSVIMSHDPILRLRILEASQPALRLKLSFNRE